jgi:AhpD family alkylhydroperoxidase
MTSMKEKLQEVGHLTRRLEREFPKETEGFLNFIQEAEGGAALSLREKELINTALSVAAQCEWCVPFHVRNAIRAGASRNEIIEAGFQAVIMHGGPAFMWMTPLMQAVDEFAEEVGNEMDAQQQK